MSAIRLILVLLVLGLGLGFALGGFIFTVMLFVWLFGQVTGIPLT